MVGVVPQNGADGAVFVFIDRKRGIGWRTVPTDALYACRVGKRREKAAAKRVRANKNGLAVLLFGDAIDAGKQAITAIAQGLAVRAGGVDALAVSGKLLGEALLYLGVRHARPFARVQLAQVALKVQRKPQTLGGGTHRFHGAPQ